ncbi:hypothetical protein OPV22_005680 [Ensete ventricosum]|uniref:DUF4005 domain-containing protein n=1 Tax=Ensete ventricosum TaxID=4639 RepID=A0AAV8RN27_ENSVE|nr:hypothetical protein OPV22_005680 [Ensete ventricosum]
MYCDEVKKPSCRAGALHLPLSSALDETDTDGTASVLGATVGAARAPSRTRWLHRRWMPGRPALSKSSYMESKSSDGRNVRVDCVGSENYSAYALDEGRGHQGAEGSKVMVHEPPAVALDCYVSHPLTFLLFLALRRRRRPLALPLLHFAGAGCRGGSHDETRLGRHRWKLVCHGSRLRFR